MECKPREILWIAGEDDGPCREKEDLKRTKSVET